MDEKQMYEHIGEWLVSEKGCQSEKFFYGYVIDTAIQHKRTEKEYRPDVVAVRYERTETKTPSYKFHFHIVEAKADTDPPHIQNLMGEIENLRQHCAHAVLAADTISWYVAIPSLEVPHELRNWAQENDVGVIAVESSSGVVTNLRELLPPERKDMGIKRSEFVSNRSQRSPGNFRKAIKETSILKHIMVAAEFFDRKLRE